MDDEDVSNDKIRIRLLDILTISKINHDAEILTQPTLKHAHIYCKINKLSGQLSGPLIEKYIKCKYSMLKNNASLCNGDLRHNQENIEIKASNGGKDNNKFNYVQIRVNHTCCYILTAYYIHNCNIDVLGELFIFKINKDDIKKIIFNYGGYAHGTKNILGDITIDDLNDNTNRKEYAIRPKYDDDLWNELLQFRIDENCI